MTASTPLSPSFSLSPSTFFYFSLSHLPSLYMPACRFQVKRFNKVEHLSINRNCLSYYFYRLRFVYIAQAQAAACQIATGHAHTHTNTHIHTRATPGDALRYLRIAIAFHLSAFLAAFRSGRANSTAFSHSFSFFLCSLSPSILSLFSFHICGLCFRLSFCLSRQSNFPASFQAISLAAAAIKASFEVSISRLCPTSILIHFRLTQRDQMRSPVRAVPSL